MVKKTLNFDDYKKCLFNPGKSRSIYRSQLMFRNRKHEVHTVEVNKVALNRDDDKRIAKKDGVISAWSQLIMLELFTRGGITKLKLSFLHHFARVDILMSGKVKMSLLVTF